MHLDADRELYLTCLPAGPYKPFVRKGSMKKNVTRRDKSSFPTQSCFTWIRVKFREVTSHSTGKKVLTHLSLLASSTTILSLLPPFTFSFPIPSCWQPRKAAPLPPQPLGPILKLKLCQRLAPEDMAETGESLEVQTSTSKILNTDV